MLSRPLLHLNGPKPQPFLLLRLSLNLNRFSSTTTTRHHPFLVPGLLKQCKTRLQASLVHGQVLLRGLTPFFSTSLLSTYLALQAFSPALSLLRTLPPSAHLVYHWNALIRGRSRPGDCLILFAQMRGLGWSPDEYTYPFVLKGCGEVLEIRVGRGVHAGVVRTGFESNVFVCNAVVAMYGKCGELGDARKVFDEMFDSGIFDLMSWISVVTCCVQGGDPEAGLRLFGRMREVGCGTESQEFLQQNNNNDQEWVEHRIFSTTLPPLVFNEVDIEPFRNSLQNEPIF